MGEFARVGLFAQAALVVLADQVRDARALVGWDVMAVGAVRGARTVAGFEVRAEGPRGFGGLAEGWVGGLEAGSEGEGRGGGGGRMEEEGRKRGRDCSGGHGVFWVVSGWCLMKLSRRVRWGHVGGDGMLMYER